MELIGNNNGFMLRKMFECGVDNYDDAVAFAEDENS